MNYNIGDYQDSVFRDFKERPIQRSEQREGIMPLEMLARKFEETDIGFNDGMYHEYARRTLVDWGPDPIIFPEEEPRKNTQDYGYLNLLHNGHRGEAEPAAHPEAFIGFAGKENRDPRGWREDPDFQSYRKQLESRNRFQHFDNDDGNENQIPELMRSQFQINQDQLKVNNIIKDRNKIFTTSIDTFFPGKNPDVGAQRMQSKFMPRTDYGWEKKDELINIDTGKQKFIVKKTDPNIIKNMTDQSFADITFAGLYKRGRKAKGVQPKAESKTDSSLSDSKNEVYYKVLGALMKDATMRDKQTPDGSFNDGQETKNTINKIQRDINKNRKQNTKDGFQNTPSDELPMYKMKLGMDLSGNRDHALSDVYQTCDLEKASTMYKLARDMDNNKLVKKQTQDLYSIDIPETIVSRKTNNAVNTNINRKLTNVEKLNDGLNVATYRSSFKLPHTDTANIHRDADSSESTNTSSIKANYNIQTHMPVDPSGATLAMGINASNYSFSAPLQDIKQARKRQIGESINSVEDESITSARGNRPKGRKNNQISDSSTLNINDV